MMVKTLEITRDELEGVKCFSVRFRADWPAAFSTNEVQEIRLWKRWGNTPSNECEEVRGKSRIVDAVAGEYLSQRRGGGRFFMGE